MIDLVCCSKTDPIAWQPVVLHTTGQTSTSYQKQVQTLQVVQNEIDNFAQGSNMFTRHQLVIGRPGSGKTSVLLVALTYGERAQSLGEHLHQLACLPV